MFLQPSPNQEAALDGWETWKPQRYDLYHQMGHVDVSNKESLHEIVQ